MCGGVGGLERLQGCCELEPQPGARYGSRAEGERGFAAIHQGAFHARCRWIGFLPQVAHSLLYSLFYYCFFLKLFNKQEKRARGVSGKSSSAS